MSATSLSQVSAAEYQPKRVRWFKVKEQLTAYLFIFPAVSIITVFGLFPIGYAFYMSLFNWRVKKGDMIGLGNYTKTLGDWGGVVIFVIGFILMFLAYLAWMYSTKYHDKAKIGLRIGAAALFLASFWVISTGWEKMLASGDDYFLGSLPITVLYALSTVPAELLVALILAYILFQKIRGQSLFRMLYFLPYVTPVVAAAVVFRSIFSPRETSLANIALAWFNIPAQKWLFEPRSMNSILFGLDNLEGLLAGPSMALFSIALFGIWTYVGYNTVIFLAGLGSISSELYEAAEIDGANHWQLFRHITVPLLSPVTFYLALIAFIGTFKAFNHIWVMSVPSAQGTVDVTSVAIFTAFYERSQYGYAAAQAIVLFVIILALTYVQNKVFGEKVFYG